MKMEVPESLRKISGQHIEGSQGESHYTGYSRSGLGVLHQSNLAEIHLQQQQLLHQFSLLQRNITIKDKYDINPRSVAYTSHPLFSHGSCNWAGCEARCQSIQEFCSHLARSHTLDDKSTAQTKVQMQIVEQLEQQLQKEQQRLSAMMEHLKQTKHSVEENPEPGDSPGSQMCLPFASSLSSSSSPGRENSQCGPVRKRSVKREEGCETQTRHRTQDTESEMGENREFYRSQDVRPPFTYAALIRQAINESRGRQLTLNEIYNWFQANFAFFRRNAATWKNAVRHNLSLHKCFSRVENVKGAVWTVDEAEFYRRRPQRSSDHGSHHSASPPPHPAVYEETFNRSLQSALLSLGQTGDHCRVQFTDRDGTHLSPVSQQDRNQHNRLSVGSTGDSDVREDVKMETVEEDISTPESVEEVHDEEDNTPEDLSMISNRSFYR